jgi:hypothetical protein
MSNRFSVHTTWHSRRYHQHHHHHNLLSWQSTHSLLLVAMRIQVLSEQIELGYKSMYTSSSGVTRFSTTKPACVSHLPHAGVSPPPRPSISLLPLRTYIPWSLTELDKVFVYTLNASRGTVVTSSPAILSSRRNVKQRERSRYLTLTRRKERSDKSFSSL